ncbi:hypothetical protein CS542_08940 [Pedobacter sp. IW39]|nr:hypothetical protein CS542_08940 [Pedobacter sp. IW39]
MRLCQGCGQTGKPDESHAVRRWQDDPDLQSLLMDKIIVQNRAGQAEVSAACGGDADSLFKSSAEITKQKLCKDQ